MLLVGVIIYIELPNSITTIEYPTFDDSRNLQSINFRGTKSEWSSKKFNTNQLKFLNSINKVICTDGEINI